MKNSLLALTASIALALAGCTSLVPEAAPTPPPADESVYGGFDVDLPAEDEVVLTVTGARTLEYTYGELLERATLEITIVEPFVRDTQSFSGIRLAELFDEAGVRPEEPCLALAGVPGTEPLGEGEGDCGGEGV